MRNLGRKEETKWNLLVCKVLERGGTMGFMPGRRKNFINPKASWVLPRGSSCIWNTQTSQGYFYVRREGDQEEQEQKRKTSEQLLRESWWYFKKEKASNFDHPSIARANFVPPITSHIGKKITIQIGKMSIYPVSKVAL
jgi:hypothetical protein